MYLGLALDEPTESDTACTTQGIDFIVEERLVERLGEISIDYRMGGFSVRSEKPLVSAGSAC